MEPIEMFVIEERHEKYGAVANGYKFDGDLYLKEVIAYNDTMDALVCSAFTNERLIFPQTRIPAFDTVVMTWFEPFAVPANEKVTLEIAPEQK